MFDYLTRDELVFVGILVLIIYGIGAGPRFVRSLFEKKA
jgi:hypothetical protein